LIDKTTGRTRNGWKTFDPKTGQETANYFETQSLSSQFTGAGNSAEAREAAGVASSVLAEVKDGYAGNLMGKMPSFVKGQALAFQGVQAEALSNFHENEIARMVQYTAGLPKAEQAETWARIGQSVEQIVENPEKYNMSPKALAELKSQYGAYVGAN